MKKGVAKRIGLELWVWRRFLFHRWGRRRQPMGMPESHRENGEHAIYRFTTISRAIHCLLALHSSMKVWEDVHDVCLDHHVSDVRVLS